MLKILNLNKIEDIAINDISDQEFSEVIFSLLHTLCFPQHFFEFSLILSCLRLFLVYFVPFIHAAILDFQCLNSCFSLHLDVLLFF